MAKNNIFDYWNGLYRFYLADRQVYKTEDVHFIYDCFDGNSVLIKHGSKERLEDYIKQAKSKAEAKGFPDAFNFKLIGTKGLSVEELNKMVNISGYLPSDLKGIING